MGRGDLVMCLIIFLGSIFLFCYTFTFQAFPQYGSVDSAFWPRIVLLLLMFTALMSVFESFRKLRSQQAAEHGGENGIKREGLPQLLGTAALILVYVFIGLQYVGFTLSTLVFVPAVMWVLGNRRPLQLSLAPLLITGICVVVFARLLYVPLPRGVGIFHSISLLFY